MHELLHPTWQVIQSSIEAKDCDSPCPIYIMIFNRDLFSCYSSNLEIGVHPFREAQSLRNLDVTNIAIVSSRDGKGRGICHFSTGSACEKSESAVPGPRVTLSELLRIPIYLSMWLRNCEGVVREYCSWTSRQDAKELVIGQ